MIHLTIVSPERKLLDKQVDEVILPGAEGYFGVLEDHTPLLSALKVGDITYRAGSETGHVMVAWGFVEVLRDRVSVLADIAERAEEIDLDRARAARDRATEALKEGDVDWADCRAKLDKAVARIQIAEKR